MGKDDKDMRALKDPDPIIRLEFHQRTHFMCIGPEKEHKFIEMAFKDYEDSIMSSVSMVGRR